MMTLLIIVLLACISALVYLITTSEKTKKQTIEIRNEPYSPLYDFASEYVSMNYAVLKTYKDLIQTSYESKRYSKPVEKPEHAFSRFMNDSRGNRPS
jgi:hypothetical protein